ncbi:MAG TPA: AraC family transcriptional regulator [Beijerinckiaceae bacterium]|jgi:AraC-like DNA-binding protein
MRRPDPLRISSKTRATPRVIVPAMNPVSPEASLDAAPARMGDVTRFWRVERYRGLEGLRATFRRHRYARHTHETYAVAAILEGCETFFHRGEQRYAFAGSLAVVEPNELHDGEPYGGPFEYRTIYPSPALMQEVAEDLAGRSLPGPPHFPRSIMPDPGLAADLAGLHAALDAGRAGIPLLEQDARLIAFLGRLVARWGEVAPVRRQGRESRAVSLARQVLDEGYAEEIGLPHLARVAGLSQSHLIRAFRAETGLTPHAYLIDRRFRAAQARLSCGEGPAEVAAACGFCDQSHLNRVFKARMGVTPGLYRAA